MFTKYGKTLANDKDDLVSHIGDRTGAAAHAHTLSLDTGLDMRISGKNVPTRTYRSVAAAYFALQALPCHPPPRHTRRLWAHPPHTY